MRLGSAHRFAALCWGAINISACNGLFYYPTQEMVTTPAEHNLKYQDERIPTKDGLSLHGWTLWAQKQPVRGVVVHFHGNAQNISNHFWFVRWLPSQGFHVLTFDYRGYGQSQGRPSRDGLVLDGQAVMEHVRSHQSFKGLDLFVLGQSLGGAVAVPTLAKAGTDRVKALILDSTFSSYRGIARDKLDSAWLTWAFQWPLSFLVSDDLSPIDSINQLGIPVLFIHGKHDQVVPDRLARPMFDTYTRATKEFWEVDLPGHTPAFGFEDSPYYDKLASYLTRRGADRGQ